MDHLDERELDLSATLRAAYEGRSASSRSQAVRSSPDCGSEELARARTSFLVDEPVEPGIVREPILASWTRSRHYDVDADRLELPYDSDISMDTVLTRAAGPIVREVADQLTSEPVSLILTDSDGVVLDRRSGDGGLTHHLDRIWLAPGFSYAERYVGTNGIGTALEGRGPAQVFGHEHYAEHLEDLACAGAPIRHPVNGKVVGVIDLTCWRSDANMMMMAIASTVAKRIEETLLEQSGRRELALLHDYLIACQRGRGAVFALSDDLLMMNDRARELFDPADQGPLLAEAGEALKSGHRHQVLVDLPSGNTARIQLRPSWTEGDRTGGIAQVQLITNGAVPTPRVTSSTPALPAAVGSGALWAKCCQAVDRHFRTREWLVLEGEPGTGKTTIARATHQGRTPAAHLRVFDTEQIGPRWMAELTEELESGSGGTLVLQHIDRLDTDAVLALADALEPYRESTDLERPWVVATVSTGSGDPGSGGGAAWRELLSFFPSTVEVPPLRHHVEDVADLVPYLIARLTRGAELTCSPEAMRVLMRNRWPGNVEQLYQVLRKVVARRRTGVVTPADLPAETRAITRRVLTPLEAIECDAIVDALLDASGNKAEAARHLGMSRATIYRKIRGYGISMPTSG
ncbi:sigma-54-dependent Fis family transcriptional regulator [Pseudonocardia oceani]|uniref:sigma-54-dependent Fis family transcriptional regulator n=1 Tax=Pseudonocardia oceani TaxID=2792013 RepID=UPI001CED281D|nr:helix-turn-helix domain-containing protein [Pseudonocardia oceani]